jgi:glutaconate CoA-transferase subunit B
MDIKPSERMVCRAAEELAGSDVVFVGIGLPSVACNLARATHATDLFMIYESGTVGTIPERLPISIGDPALVTDSLSICTVADIFQNYLQRGNISIGFLSGAQIDPYGNLNTTTIGDYKNPKVRLPGSGGACEIAVHSKKILIVMRMSPKTFVENCDFITSPGRRVHGKSRAELGCPGAGPVKVITDLGVLEFDQDDRMIVTEIYEGVSREALQAACGFELKFAPTLRTVKEPPNGHIDLLRKKLDPQNLYL